MHDIYFRFVKEVFLAFGIHRSKFSFASNDSLCSNKKNELTCSIMCFYFGILQGVWGFITGGLTWFAIPFSLATTMGLAYLGMSSAQGAPLLSEKDVSAGNISHQTQSISYVVITL